MKRAIIYGRISTNKQNAESIETQIAECEKWAINNNCTVVDIYDDSGQSGRAYNVRNRAGFQQIKEDAKAGRMDYALIHKIDRFARSVRHYFNREEELEQYGVKIIVVSMPFLQDADIVSKSVHIAMAEQFSTNLSDEVSKKMRTYARKGAYLGGRSPYGFNVAVVEGEKTLVINEKEAEVIRLIFNLYLQSYGYTLISQKLNKLGYKNADGKSFQIQHVKSILQNKKYNGVYVYGRYENNGDRKRKLTKDAEKLIEIPGVYDKIIDDETFNAVQDKIKSKQIKNKRKLHFYPLTGSFVCGVCGRAVVGYSYKYKNKHNKYYRCLGRRLHDCNVPAVRSEELQNFILSKIKQYLFDDAFTANLIKQVEADLHGDVNEFKRIEADLQKEIKRERDILKNALRDKYAEEIDAKLYNEIVEESEALKNALEIRLVNIQRQISVTDKTDSIKKYIAYLRKNLEKAADDVKLTILKQIVQACVLLPGKVEVYLNISAPPISGRVSALLSKLTNGNPSFTLDSKNNNQPIVTDGRPNDILYSNKIKVYNRSGVSMLSFVCNMQ